MLKRCPSCQASVLDDDAEVCPFCGSSMDPAKAKAAKPAAARTPTPAAKPAAARPAAAGATTAKGPDAAKAAAPPADDDPLARDVAGMASATPLAPRATATKPHKVVCPMCDTPGYAPESASGKQVRCANPKCLVPVFTAPDFAAPKPVVVPPQPSRLTGPTALTFAAVLLILAGGAATWFFVLRKESPTVVGGGPVVPSGPTAPETPETPGETTDPAAQAPTPAAVTPAERLDRTLARLPEIAQDLALPRRKAIRRRYAAESLALAGRVEPAREQIRLVGGAMSSDAFYKVSPLVEVAWSLAGSGDDAAARAAFDESTPLATSMPTQGFDPTRVAVIWAAAANRFGQADAGRELVRSRRDDPAGEQLLALTAAAAVLNAGDLDAEAAVAPLRGWREPKEAAVTLELLRRNRPDEATAWATAAADPVSKAESRAALAEATLARQDLAPDARAASVTEAVAQSDPAERTYVLARAAVRSAADAAAAGGFLDQAVAAAGQIGEARPYELSDVPTFYRAQLPDQSATRFRAVALAEAARAAARLGRTDQAWTLLSSALNHLRAAGPSPPAVAERAAGIQGSTAGVQSQLKSALNLSDDAARSAANEYRRKVREAETVAAERFDLQADLLAQAVGWGLADKVLAEAQSRSKATAAAEREPFLSGPAGGRLLAAFHRAGNAVAVQALQAAGAKETDVPQAEAMAIAADGHLAAGRADAAAREVYSRAWPSIAASERLTHALRLGTRAVRRSVADGLAFARAIPDEVAREETLRAVAYAGARGGKAAEVEDAFRKSPCSVTERSALGRGLVEGLVASGVTPPASPQPTGP